MSRFEKAMNVAVVLAALWLAGTVGFRELRTRSISERPPVEPEYVSEWRSLLPIGITRGPAAARMHVVEFTDLECPYCRQFHETLEAVLASGSGQVAATFVHYPLRMHRFALPAALATECAHEQGRFFAFVDRVLRGQDSLGLKTWSAFAGEAGVHDTLALTRCIRERKSAPRITQGLEAGDRIGVRGTPTVIVNGWKLVGTPTRHEMERVLNAIMRDEEPFSGQSGKE